MAEIQRASEMLRIAANFIQENCPDGYIIYDDAKCDGSCVADGCNAAADGLSDAVGVPSNEAKRILDLWFTEVDGDVRVSFQLVRALQQANGNPIGVYRALTEVAEGVG